MKRGGLAQTKKVVSGRPAGSRASLGPCKPLGYNPVELSRFAAGIHPACHDGRLRDQRLRIFC
jgi:hypothetical protein